MGDSRGCGRSGSRAGRNRGRRMGKMAAHPIEKTRIKRESRGNCLSTSKRDAKVTKKHSEEHTKRQAPILRSNATSINLGKDETGKVNLKARDDAVCKKRNTTSSSIKLT